MLQTNNKFYSDVLDFPHLTDYNNLHINFIYQGFDEDNSIQRRFAREGSDGLELPNTIEILTPSELQP
ncbi:threonyl-tRNA synthetase [Bacillus sp. SG-1]|nr:threonyl-tRNA synthetase [Bacillus sp. SG-1]